MLHDLAQPVQRRSAEMSMIDSQQSVASLVLEHSECASVLQRHRIDFCCRGEVPLAVACSERGLDVGDVVRELERAISSGLGGDEDTRKLSSRALISHIVLRYHAPLRNTLPVVRALAAKVARVHGAHNPRLVELNATVAEVADVLGAHIDEEETRFFPAFGGREASREITSDLLRGMREEHAAVGGLLRRMRAESEDYLVPDWACASYRTLFRELDRLETDVLRHVHLENHVLLPRFAYSGRLGHRVRRDVSGRSGSLGHSVTERSDDIRC